MKILFAVQGTGNGHMSRARDIIPHLSRYGELDIMVSGIQVDVSLPYEIRYRHKGVSFVFGKKGGVDYWKTFNSLSPFVLLRDICSLPLKQYDLIVNDFEPVSAWAARLRNLRVVSLSHQCSFLSPKTPRPEIVDPFAEKVLKYYAPATDHIGFHFKAYDDFIQTPVIRREIRDLVPSDQGHYTVYLPSYDDKFLVKYLSQVSDVQWEIYSKHEKTGYTHGNIRVHPIHNEKYNQSLASAAGLLTGGGFEAPAEALFLGKKVMAIPMKGQYEQFCNAEALRGLGGAVAYDLNEEFLPVLKNWLFTMQPVKVDFPDNVASVVQMMVERYAGSNPAR